jgi:hypothetical protein
MKSRLVVVSFNTPDAVQNVLNILRGHEKHGNISFDAT